MDSKVSSFYNAFYKFAREDVKTNPEAAGTFFKSVIKLDFDVFADCWEYFATKFESDFKTDAIDKAFTHDVLTLACGKNYLKTVKTVTSVPALTKAIYFSSAYAMTDSAFEMIVYLLLTQKIAEADLVLKQLQKNTVAKTNFGENMVAIVEKLFFEILKKQGNVTKKVDLSRKLRTILTEYISKIKGPEKALLEQRIREIS